MHAFDGPPRSGWIGGASREDTDKELARLCKENELLSAKRSLLKKLRFFLLQGDKIDDLQTYRHGEEGPDGQLEKQTGSCQIEPDMEHSAGIATISVHRGLKRMAVRKPYEPEARLIEYVNTVNLEFDPQNPRFYRLNDASSKSAVIEEMLDDEGAQDLMRSIGEKGYFPGEPMLVARTEDGKLIVVEGNRRLAAVKLLNGEIPPPARRKTSISDIQNSAVVKPPEAVPCLIYENRVDILRYLGYRHITGVKAWDALSKAKYLSELRDAFYNDVADHNEQMKALARDIGSRADYVAQLLTALTLFIKAEEKKFFGLPIRPEDIEFSYITTALNYTNIVDWLGLESRTDTEATSVDEANLKRMFSWMFAQDQQGNTILGESRRIKTLAAVVASDDALKVLEEHVDLDEAFLFTNGPQKALEEALNQADSKLKIVWEMLRKPPHLSQLHMEIADNIFDQVKSIRNQIRSALEDE